MKVVPISQIPSISESTPDNLMRVYSVCLELEELCKASNGVGLHCFQVGIPWKVFVKSGKTCFSYYLDCVYKPLQDSKEIQILEGCLSLPGKSYKVKRYDKINLKGFVLVPEDKPVMLSIDETVTGMDAIIFQHEIDHAFGILISHHGLPMRIY